METIKCLWNSILSTPCANNCTAGISNMYLCSKLREPQFVRFRLRQIPKSIQTKYELHKFVDLRGYVYAKIKGAWYGLKESGQIANEDLVDHLAAHGYHESKFTVGLFKDELRDISFTLVVDDFGIKWTNKDDLDHLIQSLEKKYKMKVDMDSKQYVGIDLQFNYQNRTLICSMDDYIDTALQELQHVIPKQHFKGPSKHTQPTYGAKIQYVEEDQSPPLTPSKIKYIQKIIGKFLFMARAVDNTQLHALNELARKVSKGTEATLSAATHLLNYIASNNLSLIHI